MLCYDYLLYCGFFFVHRIYVNNTLKVMERTMGNYSVEQVNECLLTKLRETEKAVAEYLGSCGN